MSALTSSDGVSGAALDAMIARLHTACLTMAVMHGDGPKSFYSRWPRYKLTWWDAGNEDSKLSAKDITRRLIAPPNFAPTPKQVDDALPALMLLEGLSKLHYRVIRLRAHQEWYGEHPLPDEPYAFWRGGWRAIGEMCKVSHEKARQAHWEAVVHAFEKSMRR